MKPIDKLKELLCTVKEIEEDLMELRLWCKLLNKKSWDILTYIWWFDVLVHNAVAWKYNSYDELKSRCEILWNHPQERHLRMYIQARINKLFMILWNGDFIECNHHKDNHFNNPKYIFKELITTLDNTKDFHLQDDKVIQQILDFLQANK